jgi:ferredoxin
VSDIEERRIAGLTVRIDRQLCVGFGDCMDEAPDAIVFDDQGIATFTDSVDHLGREHVIAACLICPVDALTAYEDGALIAPLR